MLITNEKKKQINEFLLWLTVEGFFLYGSAMELIEYPGLLYTYPYLFLMLLAGIRICLQGNSWKEWLFIVCLGGISLFSYKSTCDRAVLVIALMICCAKEVGLERLLRLDLGVRISAALLYILLAFTDLVPNHIGVEVGGRPRTFFTWGHPNGMGRCVMMICLEWLYVRHGRFRWHDYAGLAVLTVLLDRTANSRAPELLIVGMIFLEACSGLLKGKEKSRLAAWAIAASAALALSIALPLLSVCLFEKMSYNPLLGQKLGTVWSRMALTWYFVQAHGITLFGSAYTPGSMEYLDMMFANAMLFRGVLFGTVLLSLSILAIRYGYKKKEEGYLLLLIVLFAYGAMECEQLNPIYTFLPVLLGMPVFARKDGAAIEEKRRGERGLSKAFRKRLRFL